MYQSMVEGRYVPWSLLVKDMPKKYHRDLDFIVDQLDWDKTSIRISRTTTTSSLCRWPTPAEGFVDRWIVYGQVDGEQLFTAKELTVDPGAKVTVKGHRGLRSHLRPGQRARSTDSPLNSPQAHSLHRADRGRILLHRGRRQGRCDLREHQ